jgi:hypothetical protein
MFPAPRRVVTGHDDQGNAIYVDDKQIEPQPTGFDCDFAVLYETHQFPASNDGWEDPIEQPTKSLANDKGVVIRIVDFKPNTKTVCLSFPLLLFIYFFFCCCCCSVLVKAKANAV